jgi:hypothetical protein
MHCSYLNALHNTQYKTDSMKELTSSIPIASGFRLTTLSIFKKGPLSSLLLASSSSHSLVNWLTSAIK